MKLYQFVFMKFDLSEEKMTIEVKLMLSLIIQPFFANILFPEEFKRVTVIVLTYM